MASTFLSNLPTPKAVSLHPVLQQVPLQAKSNLTSSDQNGNIINPTICTAPKYGFRKGFIPRLPTDYGDGGAYPECHVLQYPLNMGKKEKISHGKIAALQVDETGIVQYDSIIKQGTDKNMIIYNKFSDLQEKNLTSEQLSRPSEEEEKRIAERTREALEKKMDGIFILWSF